MSEVIGKVHQLGSTETVGSAGTFKKRTIVIATSEQYVQYIPIDFVQDKCTILDNYKVGQEVKIGINIRGNEYKGKFYVSLNGWNINKITDVPQAEAAQPQPEADDLPF
jgi:hypothetical protein